ncbi:hypothetical protein EDB81DRAFT_194334 [Dactylonectria macrodidyma]|uniref:Uncharacterized protein n=1 Tax=Dactylonectria macrodidyma TaxID=307937 RepID=A0A9P9FRH5_9HYPO|nr:hypothetical protein EDB81DRAFT_194334 [Dactylonectria macrodidyma]
MPPSKPPAPTPPPLDVGPDGTGPDTLRIPEPYGSYLQVRGSRAARRIYRAMGVWPWDIVPESPPKIWAINLLEDLALVVEHVAKDPDDSLEDLRAELRRSLARDRKPSYAGKLMAQDVHAAKKRFVKVSQSSPAPEDLDDGAEQEPVERRSGRKRRPTVNHTPNSSSGGATTSRRLSSPEGSDDYMASSITVASDLPPSPPMPRPMPRPVKALKRPGTTMSSPTSDKRGRPNSPEGSRLSAAQSLMLFSSPMAAFQMAPPFGPSGLPLRNNTTNSTAVRALDPGSLHDALRPATATFASAIDSHLQSIRESLVAAQKDIFPHRTIHQEAMSKLRTCQDTVRLIQDDIDESKQCLTRLHEETAEQAALAPQLQALQDNNMSLPPEIAQAIRSYDSRRAAKSDEVKQQEATISAKTDQLHRARRDLNAAEKNANVLEDEIQGLQAAVTRGTEAARLAHMFGVVVQLGPEGLASIERMYPEIGSLLESLLAVRGHAIQIPQHTHSDIKEDPGAI